VKRSHLIRLINTSLTELDMTAGKIVRRGRIAIGETSKAGIYFMARCRKDCGDGGVVTGTLAQILAICPPSMAKAWTDGGEDDKDPEDLDED